MKWLFFLGWFLSSISYANPISVLIGVSAQNPPLSMQSDAQNHFFGFEIELMNEICNRIKITCNYRPVIISNITSDLTSRKIDFSIAAIIRPATPLPGFLFSLAYLPSAAKFMVLKESTINSPGDIQGKSVGVRRGTLDGGHLFADFVRGIYQNKIQMTDYISTDALIMGLTNKEVDALFTNAAVVDYWYYNNMNRYKIIGADIPIGEGYAIMTTSRQDVLIKKMDDAILEILADGTYLKIYNTYFSWKNNPT